MISTSFSASVGDVHPALAGTRYARTAERLTARDIVAHNNAERVRQWEQKQEPLREAIEVYRRARQALGKKSTPDGTGPWLDGLIADAERTVAGFEALGGESFDGLAIAPLLDRADDSGAAVAGARAVFAATGPGNIHKARHALDVAEAADREVWREIGAVLDAAEPPPLQDLRSFRAAEEDIARIRRLLKSNKPAQALQAALEIGARTTGLVARLHACWIGADEAFGWIAKRRAESVAPEEASKPSNAPESTFRSRVASLTGVSASTHSGEAFEAFAKHADKLGWRDALEWLYGEPRTRKDVSINEEAARFTRAWLAAASPEAAATAAE